MSYAGDTFLINAVRSWEADEAYEFHVRVAEENAAHLWARTEDQIKHYCEEGCVYLLRSGRTEKILALCYTADEDDSWEIGGLAVDPSIRKLGIGSLLVRFSLAHLILFSCLEKPKRRVIAHAHVENDDPRKLLTAIGFVWQERITVPESANPPKTLKRNADGLVEGDRYQFSEEGLVQLRDWFREEFRPYLGSGSDRIEVQIVGRHTISDFQAGLEVAAEAGANVVLLRSREKRRGVIPRKRSNAPRKPSAL